MSKNDKAANGVGYDSYDHQVSRCCIHENKHVNCFIDIICLCASWKSWNPLTETQKAPKGLKATGSSWRGINTYWPGTIPIITQWSREFELYRCPSSVIWGFLGSYRNQDSGILDTSCDFVNITNGALKSILCEANETTLAEVTTFVEGALSTEYALLSPVRS